MPTVRLESSRLILRPFNESDYKSAYKNYCSSDKVTEFLSWPTHSSDEVTKSVIHSWIEKYSNPNYLQWAIVLKSTNEVIGSIGFDHEDPQFMGEVGYCIGDTYWHQGYMSEAFKTVIDYVFNVLNYKEVIACHDINNPHSGDVMKKCGLKFSGQKTSKVKDKECTMNCYKLTKEEYESNFKANQ